MSEAGEVRRRLASRTSQRPRMMRSTSDRIALHLQANAVHHTEEARRDVRSQGGGAALQEPQWFDWYRLGRLVRYLCDTGSYAMHLQHSGNTGEVIAYSDADWAGCTETRRSTSCCLIFWGDVLLHAHSRTQVQIGQSPNSTGAAEQQGVAPLQRASDFLGYTTKGRLMMDASSAIEIATRSGVGSVRHLAARHLWVQREVESNSFSVEKVAGPRNPADLGTKHVDVKVLGFCRDFVGLTAAHLDQQEEQEAKNW